MNAYLARRIGLCLVLSAPALFLRLSGIHVSPVLALLVFGGAVVSASFVLCWAAEAAQKDIAGALAIALLALIAVLPEYAVDLYYAIRSGSDPEYVHFAAANMTGSNRLLLGFGWPLVAFVTFGALRRMARGKAAAQDPSIRAVPARTPRSLRIPEASRLDLGFLLLLSVLGFVIPLLGSIPSWFGLLLVLVFVAYLWQAGRVEDAGEEDFVGTALVITELPARRRKPLVTAMFLVSAGIILLSAEPFATALVDSGRTLGIDSYFLVQWLAPLSSEAPEFIVAALFALRGLGAEAIGTLIASKVNQWSLLVGSIPLAHWCGGGSPVMPLDARQVEEFTLTASQALMGVAVLLALRFHRWAAVALFAVFALQFLVPGTHGRWVLSCVQLLVAAIMLVVHRRHLLPTLAAPFRRPAPEHP